MTIKLGAASVWTAREVILVNDLHALIALVDALVINDVLADHELIAAFATGDLWAGCKSSLMASALQRYD